MVETQPVTFSLGQLQDADRKAKSFVYILLAGITALAGEAAVLAIPRILLLEQRGLTTATGQAFLFVLFETIAVVAIGALTIPAYLAGALSVEVDDGGIRIDYPGHKAKALPWHDAQTRFELVDYGGYPSMVGRQRAYHLYVPYVPGSWVFNRRSLLTHDAFDAILAKANERSMRVTTIRGRALWYGRPPLIHRIQAMNSRR